MASFDDFASLLRTQQQTGRAVQVGFQSFGSHAIRMFTDDAFGIGSLQGQRPREPGRAQWGIGPVRHGRAAEA